jgi:ATP-GRASP peptide maturase of grasp-with-spasm system
MVLIVSNESDQSTANVIDWLDYYDFKWIRLNAEDIQESPLAVELQPRKKKINIGGSIVNMEELTAVWYRKDAIPAIPSLQLIDQKPYSQGIKNHLKREADFTKTGIYDLLRQKVHTLGNYDAKSLNKISCLLLAKDCGLDTPDTIITNDKNHVLNLLQRHRRIITKPVTSVYSFEIKEGETADYYCNYTEEVTENVLKEMSETFFPSLFQELIEKEIEIRTFILGDKCYSMAIFSQADNQTVIDYRKYNTEKANRNVPYQLPTEIETKIIDFMHKLSLNIGSLDIILSKEGKYFFLEVNPAGQYWTHSVICNYHLEQKVAEFLLKK